MKSNLNLNADIGYTINPGIINNSENKSRTYSGGAGFVLSSNISERIDFTLSNNININKVTNSLQRQLNDTYQIYRGSFRFTWTTKKGFILDNDLNYQQYNGLGSEFDQRFTLWNAAVGHTFFKDRTEIKLNVFDILNQNNSISRSVETNYIQDMRNTSLGRYFLLSFTYYLKNFKSKS